MPGTPTTTKEDEEKRRQEEEEAAKREAERTLPTWDELVEHWETAKEKFALWKQALAIFAVGVACYVAAARRLNLGPPSSTFDGARLFFALLLVAAPMVCHRCRLFVEKLEGQVAGGKNALDKWDTWYVRATNTGSSMVTKGKKRLEEANEAIEKVTRLGAGAKKASLGLVPVVLCLECANRFM